MKDVILSVEFVELLLDYLSKRPTGETGNLFVNLQSISQQQLKAFNEGQAREKIEAEIKQRLEQTPKEEEKQEVID